MHTIGLDLQPTQTVICLRESGSPEGWVVPVGDGRRHVIPNVVRGNRAWGSQALALGASPPLPDQRMADTDVLLFWTHVGKRIQSFLGMVSPTRANGYRAVAAIPYPRPNDLSPLVGEITQIARVAGLDDVVRITSVEALLARWAAEEIHGAEAEQVVSVVCVGDSWCHVASSRVVPDGSGRVRTVSEMGFAQVASTGLAYWLNRLLTVVRERFPEKLPTADESALRDAALEFGMKLGPRANASGCEWTGLFRERMYMDLRITWETCRGWREVLDYEAGLPIALRQTLQAIGRSRSDRVILGGPGAAWAMAAAPLEGFESVWVSSNPFEDLARGAALWDAGQIESSVTRNSELHLSGKSANIIDEAQTTRALAIDADAGVADNERPPWERGSDEI